ncbi:HNH endonuclease [bacterium AH-315-O15]|nr:HNH endonuclease [bacterium AH-315-O15]
MDGLVMRDVQRPSPKHTEIIHIDGNGRNCCRNNLFWATPTEFRQFVDEGWYWNPNTEETSDRPFDTDVAAERREAKERQRLAEKEAEDEAHG